MQKNKGSILITVGLLLIASALFIIFSNLYEAKQAGDAALEAVQQLETLLVQQERDRASEIPDYILNPNMEMPVENVCGEEYIGVLEIPALDLELPILSEWSYPRLRVAPCRYRGSAYLNDFIIAAHNYRAHFGLLP